MSEFKERLDAISLRIKQDNEENDRRDAERDVERIKSLERGQIVLETAAKIAQLISGVIDPEIMLVQKSIISEKGMFGRVKYTNYEKNIAEGWFLYGDRRPGTGIMDSTLYSNMLLSARGQLIRFNSDMIHEPMRQQRVYVKENVDDKSCFTILESGSEYIDMYLARFVIDRGIDYSTL